MTGTFISRFYQVSYSSWCCCCPQRMVLSCLACIAGGRYGTPVGNWYPTNTKQSHGAHCALWVRKWCSDVFCQRLVQNSAWLDVPDSQISLFITWASFVCWNRHVISKEILTVLVKQYSSKYLGRNPTHFWQGSLKRNNCIQLQICFANNNARQETAKHRMPKQKREHVRYTKLSVSISSI